MVEGWLASQSNPRLCPRGQSADRHPPNSRLNKHRFNDISTLAACPSGPEPNPGSLQSALRACRHVGAGQETTPPSPGVPGPGPRSCGKIRPPTQDLRAAAINCGGVQRDAGDRAVFPPIHPTPLLRPCPPSSQSLPLLAPNDPGQQQGVVVWLFGAPDHSFFSRPWFTPVRHFPAAESRGP